MKGDDLSNVNGMIAAGHGLPPGAARVARSLRGEQMPSLAGGMGR
jgi:hypothetical protein